MIASIDVVAREATIFAAIGFLAGGLDDLIVDLVYFWTRLRARFARGSLPAPTPVTGRLAVFIPAWDEATVIGSMLRATLARYADRDYRLYVGAYPNDPATIGAITQVAVEDGRVRLVIAAMPGPTTKADCLNALWRALLRDEAREGRARAVVLHDAEDLVHPDELTAIRRALATHDGVQLPVLPLIDPGSPLIAGHYADEFAEAHGKSLVVRQAVGAALPFAGVGCAVDREMLGRIAAARGGMPFDETSLTEDYELGLTVAAMGGRSTFLRARDAAGGPIAVRAYFPATLGAAVRQKARWLTGIALAGWDRTGWAKGGSIGEHWMRMRDRRATLAIPVLAIAYFALLGWALSLGGHLAAGLPVPAPDPAMRWVLLGNLCLLAWRLVARAWFTGRHYGGLQACLSLPRVLAANLIALLAARRALAIYWPTLRGRAPIWDKTAHRFPAIGKDRA
ncbi:MAG: glycosyl transferase family protein [Sphingomonas sp.]|nr:glycosyl transferase family protein [Sphingomonas sp.]